MEGQAPTSNSGETLSQTTSSDPNGTQDDNTRQSQELSRNQATLWPKPNSNLVVVVNHFAFLSTLEPRPNLKVSLTAHRIF